MADPRADKAFPVSWDQFHRDARALAWRLSDKGAWQAIVCVTRGGLVPAAVIARELGIRLIETVCVASYHDYKEQGGLEVLKPVGQRSVDLAGGDGSGGPGDRRPRRYGQDGAAGARHGAEVPLRHALCQAGGRPLVDTFITEVSQDTWIYFPWDMGYQLSAADRPGRLGGPWTPTAFLLRFIVQRRPSAVVVDS